MRPAGTLEVNAREVEPMARSWNPDRSWPKRRHRRNSAGTLEIPYDPALDDRSFLDETLGPDRERDLPQRVAPADLEDSEELAEEYASDYDRARVVAERKAELYIDAGKKAVCVVILMIIPGLYLLGCILGIFWGIKLARKACGTKALEPFTGEEFKPGPDVQDDEALAEYVRQEVETLYHPVGSCKMGNDEMAVVDHQLRVRGFQGLRVADASIMPQIPNGNTNAPSIMIGEKASDLLKA